MALRKRGGGEGGNIFKRPSVTYCMNSDLLIAFFIGLSVCWDLSLMGDLKPLFVPCGLQDTIFKIFSKFYV